MKKYYFFIFFAICIGHAYTQTDFSLNYDRAKKNVTINYDSAEHYNQLALIAAKQSKNKFQEQLAYIQKGNILYYTNKFDSSINCYLKASEINKKSNNIHYLVQNYSDIAFVYSNINKDFVQIAANWLNKAELIIDNSPDSTKAYFFKTSGVIYLRQNKPQKALASFLKQLHLSGVDAKTGHASLLNNIGICYQKQNDLAIAENYFKQCIDSCEKYSFYRVKGIALVNLAKNKSLEKKYALSNMITNEAVPILINKTAMPALIEAYGLLAKNYDKLEQKDSLLKYQKLFYQTKDSVFNESTKQQLSSLEKRLEVENKNLQIKNSFNLIQAAKKQTKLYAIIAAIIGVSFLFILILGTLLFKRNKLLRSQKEIIQDSLQEKESLLAEIHHRVKNNLQLVASLIELQLKSLKDEKSIQAIKESKNRINSMLLLHQKLYQNEKIAYIDTFEYLNTLLPVVLDSYAIKSKVRINNYAQSLKLYLDTAIPLGLIVNEIITNSVKYAFDNTSDPQIDINLYIENKELILVVKDNGQGFSDLGLAKNKSFGFKLITSMCRQLDAIFEIDNDNGAVCTIKIRNYKLYEQR